jgi:hypothetical protein
MVGLFREWQPRYAEHRVATFPVDGKRPCVRAWDKVGLRGSAQLAMKFADAEAFGFQCGKHSRITLIDIDSRSERMVGEAIRLFGESPIIWRTGNGNHAMPFRHNGEARRIRAIPGLPIDILGGGFAVAPPSIGAKGRYQFLQGGLADLDRLPCLCVDKVEPAEAPRPKRDTIPEGRRNATLFHFALEQAPHVDDIDALLDVARTRNLDCQRPLPDTEVVKAASSAWRYEQEGRNLVGCGRAFVVSNADYKRLREQGGDDAALLYCDLRCHHWGRNFVLTKAMAATMGWSLPKWKRARDALVKLGFICCIHPGGNGPHDPPIYTWELRGTIQYPNKK